MADEVTNAETAEAIAAKYADEECVGTMGEVTDVKQEDSTWVVEFKTHTFSEAFVHRVEITESVGNIVSHDRKVAPT